MPGELRRWGPLEVGLELRHFRLVGELGRGGQGSVWLAQDQRLNRRVALKVLSPVAGFTTESRERFRREAEAAARIDHPGICAIHETGEVDGTPFIAMQLVEGETLAVRIDAWRAGLPPGAGATHASHSRLARDRIAQVIELIEQAARALEHAHRLGVVHRDVKPGNLMITPEGRAVLLDFGLARDFEGAAVSVTRPGDLCGTPHYMSPEQITPQSGRIDRRTDVFSLGVTLFEALTLERPFDAPTLEGLFHAILTKEPRDPRRLVPEISKDLSVVVSRAIEKDRNRRFLSAADLADDLRAVLLMRPIRARPVTLAGRVLRWARREPALAALGLLALVGVPLLAGLAGYVLASQPEIEAGKRAQLTAEADRQIDAGFMDLLTRHSERSEGAFRAALDLDSSCVLALAGLWELRANDPKAGLALVQAHSSRLRTDPDFAALEGLALLRAGRDEEARTRLQAPLLRDSSLWHLAQAYREFPVLVSMRSPQVARDALRQLDLALFKARRPLFLTHFLRGVAAFAARDEAALDETIAAMQDLWPDNPATWFSIADWLLTRDDPRGRAAVRRALELSAGVPWVNEVAGHHCLHFGRPQEALAWFERADELGNALGEHKASLFTHRARALLALGRADEAAGVAEATLKTEPTGGLPGFAPFACIVLAEAELRRGRPEKALAVLEQAAQLDPEMERIGHERVRALRGSGALDAARAQLEESLRAHPEWPWWHFERGLTLVAEGRTDAARTALEEGLRAVTANPEWAMRNESFLWYEETGVRARLELAAALAPEDASAWSELAHFHLDSRSRRLVVDPQIALAVARRAAELTSDARNIARHARASRLVGDAHGAAELRRLTFLAAADENARAALDAELADEIHAEKPLFTLPTSLNVSRDD